MNPCQRCCYAALCLSVGFEKALVSVCIHHGAKDVEKWHSANTAERDRHVSKTITAFLVRRPLDCPNKVSNEALRDM